MPEDTSFDRVMAGLEGAVEFSNGGELPKGARVTIPRDIDVRRIRAKLNLTQEEFGRRFGFSAAAVKDWEQGRRVPEAGTRAFLKVIDREPGAVDRALEAGSRRRSEG